MPLPSDFPNIKYLLFRILNREGVGVLSNSFIIFVWSNHSIEEIDKMSKYTFKKMFKEQIKDMHSHIY